MYAHPLLVSPTASRPVPALLQTPASAADNARLKILVPVDESRTSEAAVEHVVALARSMPIEVHLLNVQAPVMAGDINPFTTAATVRSQLRTAGEKLLKRARSMLAAARIEHTAEVALGDPAPAIVRSAAVNVCDKIVMATRNSGLLRRTAQPFRRASCGEVGAHPRDGGESSRGERRHGCEQCGSRDDGGVKDA